CAAGGTVERQVMRRSSGSVSVAVILKVLGDRLRSGRHADEPAGTEPVVQFLIPLVSEHGVTDRRGGASRQRGDGRVAPEAHLAIGGGNVHRRAALAAWPTIDSENCPGHPVLGPAAVRRRTYGRIAPRARPRR